MSAFHNHSFDLARALRVGDVAAATDALDMMVRDCDRPRADAVAAGRAAGDRATGRILPLPELTSREAA